MPERRLSRSGTPLHLVRLPSGAGGSRPRVDVRSVAFDEPVAEALRAAMAAEIRLRYWHPLAADGLPLPDVSFTADEAAWTGVAIDLTGLPVGHLVLCRTWSLDVDALEVTGMYVVPSHRCSGVAKALLAAAEDEAVAMGARQLIAQTGDRQPEAVRLYRRSGYLPIPALRPSEVLAHTRCFARSLPTVSPIRP